MEGLAIGVVYHGREEMEGFVGGAWKNQDMEGCFWLDGGRRAGLVVSTVCQSISRQSCASASNHFTPSNDMRLQRQRDLA